MISGPLTRLLLQSFKGRTVYFVRMLRHPAYLLGFLAGFGGLLFWLGPVLLGTEGLESGLSAQLLQSSARLLPAFQIVASLGLALLLSVWWLMQWGSQPLSLRESEIHLLVPAPVSKRHLLQYAILKNQPRVIVGCLFMSLFLGTGSKGALLGFLSYWLFLTNWDLNAKGRNLWIARNKELPADRAWMRRALLIGAIVLFWSVFVGLSRKIFPLVLEAARESNSFVSVVQLASDAVSGSWLSIMLAPFALFLGVHFASTATSPVLLMSISANLLLILFQNEWVVRSASRFEEAALQKARRAARLTGGVRRYWPASQSHRKDVPFSLRFVNSPEAAVIWKNLLASTRIPVRRQVLIGLLSVTGLYLFLVLLPVPEWLYGVFLVTGLVLFFFFPMFAGNGYRNDFRTDLTNIELVRSWPTAPWRMFLAEIGGPAVQIGLYSALGAGITLASQLAIDTVDLRRMYIIPDEMLPETVLPRVFILGWIMLGSAPFVLLTGAMCCAMHNLLALNFSSWVPLGRKRQDAAANLGQNLLITIAIMLGMALGILPSALLLGLTLRLQIWVLDIPFTYWEMPLLGLATSLPILVLLTIMTFLGGWSWQRLDPSRQLFSES